MKELKTYKLIDKVLSGKATAAEAEQVDGWYQSFENRSGITETLNAEELGKAMDTSFAFVKSVIHKG